MTIHLRSGNMAETCHVDEKADYHVSAKRKRNGYKQIHVSVGFTKYGNIQFRPVLEQDVSKVLAKPQRISYVRF